MASSTSTTTQASPITRNDFQKSLENLHAQKIVSLAALEALLGSGLKVDGLSKTDQDKLGGAMDSVCNIHGFPHSVTVQLARKVVDDMFASFKSDEEGKKGQDPHPLQKRSGSPGGSVSAP